MQNDNDLEAYLKDIRQYDTLTENEVKELFSKKGTTDWESAKEKLLLSNLKLVVYTAKKFFPMANANGFSPMDIIMEGNIGLMAAVELYKIEKNTCFSTYAVTTIKSKILRAIESKGSLIQIPTNLNLEVYKYKQIKKEFEEKNGFEIPDEEVIKTLKIDEKKLERYKYIENLRMCSADSLVSENDEEVRILDFIKDENVEREYEKIENEEFFKLLDKAFKEYERRNGNYKRNNAKKVKDIVYSRYGVVDGDAKKLEDIAKEYGCTRERVRQIVKKFLIFCKEDFTQREKLKHFLVS